ncbi:cysteine hydrolase family protein [Parachitinimonas caeni]|uniref:Cysteine hydrolase family protein n=1 Tax=Parachitinimonas caeni TaxID=3031301 RepID=A0ABT7DVJ3_9NEIS|nr:cysteine hydrolase family protein [Parachitinimonas caeni]MDK2123849.1 cysteine hydrolase family protein [Parachitinimonas caeni]
MDTLLVIDMQNVWLNGDTRRHDKAGIIARINFAANQIRQKGGKVVFVRHCDAEAVPGSEGWQIDADLVVAEGDTFIEKTACDSFADTLLKPVLTQQGTRNLYICGLATEFCVDTTLRAALSHGFDVIALADAHTTGDRPHLTAEQIIAHHNWVWTHMAVPQGRRIQVQAVEQVFA